MNILRKMMMAGIGIAAVAAVSSCDLTTESKSAFDESGVFSDPTLTEYQLFSVYNVFGSQNGHRGRYLPYYGFNTDIEWFISSDRDTDKSDLAFYDYKTTNGQLNLDNGPYPELYSAIERVNLTIRGIREYGDPENRPEMAALLGEALTLRAVIYTELLKAFGEVPARFEPVTPETIYLNKSDRDVIYKQLLADLEESFNYMAWPGQSTATSTTARASLALAKGLYARLALMASGYALRPEPGMVGTGTAGTPNALSQDPELQKDVLYPKALAALKDIIDHAGLDLMDYEELWRSVNNMDLTAGKEIIWSIPFSDGRGRWNYTFAIRHENTVYSPAGVGNSRGGQAGPVPYLYYMYGENDLRRDISCVNYDWGTDSKPHPAGIANWYFGKYRFEWMQAMPYGGGNDDGVKPVWMRYSDILLMAAEIANEIGDTDSNNGKDYLLKVRERAYRGHEDEAQAYVNGLSGKEEVFDAIVDERALEFVGEFLRKADLIRWGMLKEKMDEAASELQAFRDGSADSPKHIDYSTLGSYCWYRHGTDSYGVPTIEMYGIHPGENQADATTPPPTGTGWMPYTSSSGSVSRYFKKTSDIELPEGDESTWNDDQKEEAQEERQSVAFWVGSTGKKIDKATAAGGFYENNPDAHQWWPIFEISIVNSQGALKNDYGY